MARSVEELLKAQLGGLLLEVAILTSKLEERDELLAKHAQAAEAAKSAKLPEAHK